MSKLDLVRSLEDTVVTIQDALEKEADRAAFFCALSIPDICAQIEYPNSKLKKMNVGDRYSQWYNENLFAYENPPTGLPLNQLDGRVMYLIRCKMYHEGELRHRGSLKEIAEKYKKLAYGDETLQNINLDMPLIEFVDELVDSFGYIRFNTSEEIVRFYAHVNPKTLAQKLVWIAEEVIRNYNNKNNPPY